MSVQLRSHYQHSTSLRINSRCSHLWLHVFHFMWATNLPKTLSSLIERHVILQILFFSMISLLHGLNQGCSIYKNVFIYIFIFTNQATTHSVCIFVTFLLKRSFLTKTLFFSFILDIYSLTSLYPQGQYLGSSVAPAANLRYISRLRHL